MISLVAVGTAACSTSVPPAFPAAGATRSSPTPGISYSPVPIPSETGEAPPGTPAWLKRELARRDGVVRSLDLSPTAPLTGGPVWYVDHDEARVGSPVAVHLSAPRRTRVRVTALRIGDYGGAPARVVWRSAPLFATPQPTVKAAGRRTAANSWPTSIVVTPDSTWPPGLYVLQVAPEQGGQPSFIPLYLANSGPKSPRLVVGSTLTHLAYNDWGGLSLYFGQGATRQKRVESRAYIASPRRPLSGRGLTQFAAMDVPLAMYLDRNGFAADWTTDTALDARPARLHGYGTVVLPGHSEYWTTAMRDRLEAAVAAGTNLAVLGGNEIHWHTRLVRDSAGSVAEMLMYRSAALDPDPVPANKTVRWYEAPLHRDPALVTGLVTTGVGIKASPTVVATPSWAFAGTGLTVGGTLEGAYGNEGDGPSPSSPPNLQILLKARAVPSNGTAVLVTTSYYAAPSGAGVFNAGTTEWLCLIEDRCPADRAPLTSRTAMDRLTYNVLAAFTAAEAGKRLTASAQ